MRNAPNQEVGTHDHQTSTGQSQHVISLTDFVQQRGMRPGTVPLLESSAPVWLGILELTNHGRNDVTADGQRFLIASVRPNTGPTINVVTNWTTALSGGAK
jgi:hypothetical protein